MSYLKQKFQKLSTIHIVFILLFILVLGVAGYYYHQTQILSGNPSAKQTANAQKEIDDVIEAVGKLLILPEDEEPTIASVTDPNLLKDQPFFAKAEVGDKVLIYSVSGTAILYRPSVNKIIGVAPFSFNNNGSTSASVKNNQPQ